MRDLRELTPEEQKQFFIQKHGKEKGEYLWGIATNASWAYDYSADESDTLPYYIWVAETYGKDITKIVPIKMQWIVGTKFTAKYDVETKKVTQLTMEEAKAEYRKFYRDAYQAIQTQVELTRGYLKKIFPKNVIKLYRATREVPLKHPEFGEIAFEEKRRAILSGSLSKRVAENFAKQEREKGRESKVIEVRVPINKVIDCYLTSIGFTHKEYEFRWGGWVR